MRSFRKWLVDQLTEKSTQNTALPYNRAIYTSLTELSRGVSITNPENDDKFVRQGYQQNATIYAIIQLIIKHASAVPFQLFEVESNSELKRYKAMTSGPMSTENLLKSDIIKAQHLNEVEDSDLEKLLNRPNPAQSYASWISELIAFGKLTGDRYIFGIGPDTGPNAGRFKELYVLPSQVVEIISGGLRNPVEKYEIDYNGLWSADSDTICHIKDFNPHYDGTGSNLYGQSPLKAAFGVLQTNTEAVRTARLNITNQSTKGLLTPAKNSDLDEVQTKALKDALKAEFRNNSGGITITNREMKWINFALSSADLQLLEQYKSTKEDLAAVYGVPVVLLNNNDASTESNVKEARKALYQNAIIPELVKIRDELNRWLVPQFGDNLFLDFDFSAIPELQADMVKMAEVLKMTDWMTQNQKRAAQGMPIDKESELMDDYLIDGGKVPLSDLDLSSFDNE